MGAPPTTLKKGLKQRHLIMIAMGGIGAGLFVGSGVIIGETGPGAFLSYAITGADFSNLTANGGFLPNAIGAIYAAIGVVPFSMVGAEVATIAAAESPDPGRAIARALPVPAELFRRDHLVRLLVDRHLTRAGRDLPVPTTHRRRGHWAKSGGLPVIHCRSR